MAAGSFSSAAEGEGEGKDWDGDATVCPSGDVLACTKRYSSSLDSDLLVVLAFVLVSLSLLNSGGLKLSLSLSLSLSMEEEEEFWISSGEVLTIRECECVWPTIHLAFFCV